MGKRKTKVAVDELIELLDEIDNGAELCVAKGIAGHDLSAGVTLLVAHLIEGFLYRHRDMEVDDEN